MRGTFFFEGQEFAIETLGESWKQGAFVKGKISSPCTLALAYGDFKSVRAKDDSAWDILEEKKIEGGNWEFQLKPDAPLTETKGSLFILLKKGEVVFGHLQLNVELKPMLKSFLETFELFFRFKTHSFKNRKGGFVEFKMIPPKTREYANMDQLLLSLRLAGEAIEVKYCFSLKALEMSASNIGQAELKKNKRELEQTLSKRDYELCEGVHNPDGMKKFLAEALAQAAPKMLF